MRAKGSPLIGLFMLVLVTGARAQQTAGAALLETRSKGSLNPDAPWSNSQEKEPENVMNLTPLMTNPVNTHPYHRPGRVVFPMVFDSKLNPFLNNSPYNPIPGTTLVQVPAPVSDGHPSEGIGVFPPGFLEIEASSSSSRSPYHSHYSHNHNHNRYHSAPSHAPAPRFSQDRAGTAVEQRLRQKAVVKATLKAMVKDGAPATWALPTAPFDPFTKEEDPILNFNPYNPYTRVGHWTRRNVPPGQARSFTGPVLAVPPGDPTVMGVPVGMGGG